jgi:diaminopimelate epimerase
MKFTKMHGAGNDYLFIDARFLEADWPTLSRTMSNRHLGVGSDGIILILDSDRADLKMRMFNADGSEGEMCGNGIRCFAKYAYERGIVDGGGPAIQVETLTGVRVVVPTWDGNSVVTATVNMGEPEFRPKEVPVKLPGPPAKMVGKAVVDYPFHMDGVSIKLTFLSMGNPHAVAFLDEPVERYPLHIVGPKIEHHPMFPQRINFEIVNILNRSQLEARVWERGSGETMACGSGASAIAVAAQLIGHCQGPVDIKLPGGTLNVQWDDDGQVYLKGPAVEVFEGEWGG